MLPVIVQALHMLCLQNKSREPLSEKVYPSLFLKFHWPGMSIYLNKLEEPVGKSDSRVFTLSNWQLIGFSSYIRRPCPIGDNKDIIH